MAQIDNSFHSLSIDELYNKLTDAIRDMFNASDGTNHDLFLEKKDQVGAIREIIEQKKEVEMINMFKIA